MESLHDLSHGHVSLTHVGKVGDGPFEALPHIYQKRGFACIQASLQLEGIDLGHGRAHVGLQG